MELLAKVLSVQSEGAEKLEDDFDDITARKPLAAKAKRVADSIADMFTRTHLCESRIHTDAKDTDKKMKIEFYAFVVHYHITLVWEFIWIFFYMFYRRQRPCVCRN